MKNNNYKRAALFIRFIKDAGLYPWILAYHNRIGEGDTLTTYIGQVVWRVDNTLANLMRLNIPVMKIPTLLILDFGFHFTLRKLDNMSRSGIIDLCVAFDEENDILDKEQNSRNN